MKNNIRSRAVKYVTRWFADRENVVLADSNSWVIVACSGSIILYKEYNGNGAIYHTVPASIEPCAVLNSVCGVVEYANQELEV